MAESWALVITELRRYPQLCYKSDIIVISGKIFFLCVALESEKCHL